MLRPVCLAALSAASSSFAQTYTWTGGAGDYRWSTAANWVDGLVPQSSLVSTITFPETLPGPVGYMAVNDLPALDVGTIQLLGGYISGNTVRVHQRIDGGMTGINGMSDWPLEIAGDVRLVSPTPAPVPGSYPATVSYLSRLTGTGSATFEGGWRVDQFEFSGDLTIHATGSLMTYADSAGSLRSFDGDGLISMTGTFLLPPGQVADLTAGVVDLGRNDLTLGGPIAGELAIDGDVALGGWMIYGVGFDPYPYADRLSVTGTLDLTRSHVLDGSFVGFVPPFGLPNPAYLVLASYGERVGSLDRSTIAVDGYGQSLIIYTSPENAGPGEIRVLLPEPSIIVTVAAAGLLVRRRREE